MVSSKVYSYLYRFKALDEPDEEQKTSAEEQKAGTRKLVEKPPEWSPDRYLERLAVP